MAKNCEAFCFLISKGNHVKLKPPAARVMTSAQPQTGPPILWILFSGISILRISILGPVIFQFRIFFPLPSTTSFPLSSLFSSLLSSPLSFPLSLFLPPHLFSPPLFSSLPLPSLLLYLSQLSPLFPFPRFPSLPNMNYIYIYI